MDEMRPVALIGAGPMAVEYAKVLRALGETPVVVGRGEDSAARFTSGTGLAVHRGGVDEWLASRQGDLPSAAIVACGEKWIGSATRALVEAGVSRVLVEKPGGFDAADIVETARTARRRGAEVRVGYNRRFYASVSEARRMIDEDGGVRSFVFEFTEWAHVIAGLEKEEGVKAEWLLSNSTHVIDLAFHLGGTPERWDAFTAGALPWHPAAAVFAGAGLTRSGALFSYHANWQAPGRWGLEVLTPRRRLIFRPLETLQVQELGQIAATTVDIDAALDQQFKPGLYRQCAAFLNGDTSLVLPAIDEQVGMLRIYRRMRGDDVAAEDDGTPGGTPSAVS